MRIVKEEREALQRKDNKPRVVWRRNGRTDAWCTNLTAGELSAETWNKNFRMSEEEFKKLADELRPFISPDNSSPNYMAITVEKKLAITLYYLKDTGSLVITANTFGVALCTVSVHIIEICRAMSRHLGPKYVYLPRNKDEMRQVTSEFEAKFGMPQAFGCVDGTHVEIKRPSSNSQEYFNYKQFFSLSVQAVCDFQGRFMDGVCKWPGSVHDAKIFSHSSINKKLANSQLPITTSHYYLVMLKFQTI